MAIRLHGFLSSPKRYVQIESQSYHVTGIFQSIIYLQHLYSCNFAEVDHAYYECDADGTITFYEAKNDQTYASGIWTYLVYDCPEGEEQIFRDQFINTTTSDLDELLAGKKLSQVTVNIHEYLKYKTEQCKYLHIQLPDDWNNVVGREITDLLLEEIKAFKNSDVFKEDIGKQYIQATLKGFIQAAQEILAKSGTVRDFESAQYDVLNTIEIDAMANLIIEYNDYRIWQAALPSKSKAVEFAFNTALSLICRIK